MKTTQKQASKRLFKKLSALRATLSNEERKILDNIIVDEAVAHRIDLSKNAEVNANQMKVGKIATKNAGKIAGRVATKIIFDPNSEEYKISE